MSGPQILDVIVQRWYDQTFYYVVVDRPIEVVYERRGNELTGRHGDFYDFLGIAPGSSGAFGGRKFDVTLTDGSKFHCHGQVWACGAPEELRGKTLSIGACTLAELQRCYVFFGSHVLKETLDAWLANNEPSTDYYKYDEQRKWWREVLPTLRIVRNRRRARLLRQRGESIKWEPRVDAWTWSRVRA